MLRPTHRPVLPRVTPAAALATIERALRPGVRAGAPAGADLVRRALRGACAHGYLSHLAKLARKHRTTREAVLGDSLLHIAAAKGHQALLAWLARTFAIGADDVTGGSCPVTIYAVVAGQLRVVKWLVEHYGLTGADLCPGAECELSLSDGAAGTLATVRWLMGRFGWRIGNYYFEYVRSLYEERYDCCHKQIAQLRWMDVTLSRFKNRLKLWAISRSDVVNYGLLAYAVAANRLDIAGWLADEYGLTAADMRANCNYAISDAAECGHFGAVRWAIETFGLTAADVRLNRNQVLLSACQHGDLDFVKWLVAAVGLDADDVREDDCGALRWACANGHRLLVEWLVDTFGLTAGDVGDLNASFEPDLITAIYHGEPEAARWLVAKFGAGRLHISYAVKASEPLDPSTGG